MNKGFIILNRNLEWLKISYKLIYRREESKNNKKLNILNGLNQTQNRILKNTEYQLKPIFPRTKRWQNKDYLQKIVVQAWIPRLDLNQNPNLLRKDKDQIKRITF